MAVIVGNSTTVVTTLFPDGGIISVSFGINPQITRLWQLGSFSPYDTYVQNQRELSLTAHAQREDGSGGSETYDLTPSTTCVDADPISITVNPGVCEVAISPFTYDYVPSSYGYSKENLGWGTESWSFITKPTIDTYTGDIVILRGIATGSLQVGDGMMVASDMGITINDADSRDHDGNYIEGESGSVQAGQNALGEYSTRREVVVQSVGSSIGRADGFRGQSSVSIPTEIVYL